MGIKLSISNIAWTSENDQAVYAHMQKLGFQGLEIAPTRLFPEAPYQHKAEVRAYRDALKAEYGLKICSMQSIWYGRGERIFGTDEERAVLLDYTRQVIGFAEAAGAGNIVFGCPKNRCIGEHDDIGTAVEFFRALGDCAAEHGTVVAMEANPVIYGTNFLNGTQDAVDFIRRVDSRGFKLNLDFGTIVYNEERIDALRPCMELVNHVHISEPYLKMIEQRDMHRALFTALRDCGYDGFVSIEMGRRDDIGDVYDAMDYLATL